MMISVESHSDVSQPIPSEKSSLGIVEFGFHAKTSFDADDALLLTRSEKFRLNTPPRDDDIWKRPPPDFRYVVYAPKPPPRNTRDSQQPWRYGTYPGQRTVYKREPKSLLPIIFRSAQPRRKEFVTRFHIARPFTAKKDFVRNGMNVPGEYVPPKPHDHRGVGVKFKAADTEMLLLFYQHLISVIIFTLHSITDRTIYIYIYI